MNVLLILPPCTPKDLFGDFAGSNPFTPPLDIASTASYLEKQGHCLAVFDCFSGNISMPQLKSILEKQSPQVVGITVDLPTLSSPLLPQAYRVARLCKDLDPEIKTIFYGFYPTRFPGRVLIKEEVDFVVKGEGEITTAKLLSALENGDNIDHVEGISFRRGGKIVNNQQREHIKDLDVLPFPAYHHLPMAKYKACPTSRKKRRQMIVQSSRGCPFNCYLCTSPLFSRRQWRAHSPEYMVDNLDFLNKKYGIDDFHFRDELFTVNRDRVVQFCSLLKKRKKNYSWNCYATFNAIDRDLIQLMKSAGCDQLNLGVETGSEQILGEYKKITRGMVQDGVNAMKEIGMESRLFFIIGPPSKTKQDVEQTIDFALKLNPDYALFSPSTPYPGSDYYDRLAQKGSELPDFERNLFVDNEAVCDLPEFDRAYISRMVSVAFRRFYLRPAYIWKKLISIRSFGQIKILLDGFTPLMSYLNGKK